MKRIVYSNLAFQQAVSQERFTDLNYELTLRHQRL